MSEAEITDVDGSKDAKNETEQDNCITAVGEAVKDPQDPMDIDQGDSTKDEKPPASANLTAPVQNSILDAGVSTKETSQANASLESNSGEASMDVTLTLDIPSTTTVSTSHINWQIYRKKLLESDLQVGLDAAREIQQQHLQYAISPAQFPLYLNALLSAYANVLTHRTRPSGFPQSVPHKFRNTVLQLIAKFPCNDVLRQHAPFLVVVATNILTRDYEENALIACRILFDLYKVYRNLPPDNVQPYLDFVVSAYRNLPQAVRDSFTTTAATTTTTANAVTSKTAESEKSDADIKTEGAQTPTEPADASLPVRPSPKSDSSFRVLTECPLMVMLIFQLYPSYQRSNIPVLISVMNETLSIRPPAQSTTTKSSSTEKRWYTSRLRELVAVQAKTLSFLTYLLRTCRNELKPYQEKLAANVVMLMKLCPRDATGTRKELLVATRHLLNASEFRNGFVRHVDSLLDERVIFGTSSPLSHRSIDGTLLRPMGYSTLSDLVQHIKAKLTMAQISRIVSIFSRALHDNSLPFGTQYTSVRTMFSLGDIIYQNKDPNPQLGRDALVRIFGCAVEKLESIVAFHVKLENLRDAETGEMPEKPISALESSSLAAAGLPYTEILRDLQSLIRAIIIGHKSIIYYIHSYRTQRDKEKAVLPPPGSNEEVSSAMLKLTHTEVALIDRYILSALPATKLLKESNDAEERPPTEKSLSEYHRETVTYFAAAFTTMDGYTFRRTIGKRLEFLVDAVIEDPMVMIAPRHLLMANRTTSFEFASILIDFLVKRMDDIRSTDSSQFTFVSRPNDSTNYCEDIAQKVFMVNQRPKMSIEMRKQISTTLVHLFERVLKSLATFAENEAVVRKHLRVVVVTCLQCTLENSKEWPDGYCMLLRHIFRAISAGKFEESYKVLLPLIPTVLNGLYRVCCTSQDTVMRNTMIELCLTIPARLSSLLPHIDLLLRVIVPALDSDSSDLVNLGLRTLEFWVDNLNPLFLYPEISKNDYIFVKLMQALSRHLRPAPYAYGLLTLRLLGKLGGKNRQFLRNPISCTPSNDKSHALEVFVPCRWAKTEIGEDNSLIAAHHDFHLSVDVQICVKLQRTIANKFLELYDEDGDKYDDSKGSVGRIIEMDEGVTVEKPDARQDSREVLTEQAAANFGILSRMIDMMNDKSNLREESRLGEYFSTVGLGLLYSCAIPDLSKKVWDLFPSLLKICQPECLATCISCLLVESADQLISVGTDFIKLLCGNNGDDDTFGAVLNEVCKKCNSSEWNVQDGLQKAIIVLCELMTSSQCKKYESILVNTAFLCVKCTPREASNVAMRSFTFFVKVCSALYGSSWEVTRHTSCPFGQFVFDQLYLDRGDTFSSADTPQVAQRMPNEDVVCSVLQEVASTQQLVRICARFLFVNFICVRSSDTNETSDDDGTSIVKKNLSLVKRTLFSRTMKLLPLPQQIGVVEGLSIIVKEMPKLLPLTEQHMLAFLSELLKMASVADGDMSDAALKNYVVNKNGFVTPSTNSTMHAFSTFYRRDCAVNFGDVSYLVPGELSFGIQLRVSLIILLHNVIQSYKNVFFDADTSSPIGNIRPHVISLLFRSLVSAPLQAVLAARYALKDVLSLSVIVQSQGEGKEAKSHSRLPKELLQTCIRPVLLNLRDHSRLSLPLLRGLAQLLSLLSSWFNKTLGEKLLDHLQKWADPTRMLTSSNWSEGEELHVAAAVVDIFSLLPHASHFVEPLVKTCMKLEVASPIYKSRYVESPFLGPLSRYLSKYCQHTVTFFFQRLKSPIYSELFHSILGHEYSKPLRVYLSNSQCSAMILNICFEKPLSIIRQERGSSATSSQSSLLVHGINSYGSSLIPEPVTPSDTKPMTIESLELQFQGFRLISTLVSFDLEYLSSHSEIVRAFRWLWRSKGRYLRLQHEGSIAPRYHSESTMLAGLLVSYTRSSSNNDLDILFELVRAFLQSSMLNFDSLRNFVQEVSSMMLSEPQRLKVLERFFSLMSGESSEEMKILSIQCIIFPLVYSKSFYAKDFISPYRNTSNVQSFHISDETAEVIIQNVILSRGSNSERMKVELFRLMFMVTDISRSKSLQYKDKLIELCCSSLNNDEVHHKYWAQLALCKLVSIHGATDDMILLVYKDILNSHSSEGKEIVRLSLQLLLPYLRDQLDSVAYSETKEQMAQILSEESLLPVPHITHLLSIIIQFPDHYFEISGRLKPSILSSLNKIGSPQSSSMEGRLVATEVVVLLMAWEDKHQAENDKFLNNEDGSFLANFIIRQMFIVSELEPRVLKTDSTTLQLERQLPTALFKVIGKLDKVNINSHHLEKIRSKDLTSSTPLLPILCTFCALAQYSSSSISSSTSELLVSVLVSAVKAVHKNPKIKSSLEKLLEASVDDEALQHCVALCIEKIMLETVEKQKSIPASKPNDSTRSPISKSADSHSPSDDLLSIIESCIFCFEYLLKSAIDPRLIFARLTTSVLNLISTLATHHLLEAAAKQRQGTWSTPRTDAPGIMSHTPTIGMIQCRTNESSTVSTRLIPSKLRGANDSNESMSSHIKLLILALDVFKDTEEIFSLSKWRKQLVQILLNILENSDNTFLLMASVRISGKWLLSNARGGPFSSKERTSLLQKMSSFDYNGLLDDVFVHPLEEMVCTLLLQLCENRSQWTPNDNSSLRRSVIACILHSKQVTREKLLHYLIQWNDGQTMPYDPIVVSWQLLNSDLEGLGGRFWVVSFVEMLLLSIESSHQQLFTSLRVVIHASVELAQILYESLFCTLWKDMPNDSTRLKYGERMERILAQPYHSQLFRKNGRDIQPLRSLNVPKSILHILPRLQPVPQVDSVLVVYLAENYNAWYEAIEYLNVQLTVLGNREDGPVIRNALTQCYDSLSNSQMVLSLLKQSCSLTESQQALSFDIYGYVDNAVDSYDRLIESIQIDIPDTNISNVEMSIWEHRYIDLNREQCQNDIVYEYANSGINPRLQLECTARRHEWAAVTSLCTSESLLPFIEKGDPFVKLCETFSAVSNGNLSDVENLHAQTAQLCLHQWQLLPELCHGSSSHSSLLHIFHQLVEVRESGQILVEVNKHLSGNKLPDLKNLLNAWRHRLPNDFDTMKSWDELFAWRSHMFDTITSKFELPDPSLLSTLHDRPWTTLTIAKTARKQGLRDVALFFLGSADDERPKVIDAYTKLREQILLYNNPQSDPERHAGLNLINNTKLSYFDISQKSELFRLKGHFLESLGGKSKANQAYCHAVQISPTYARAWDCWGGLCASLGSSAEKQIEETKSDANARENILAQSKKVTQYYAQAMGCYLEAISIEPTEWRRLALPKCLWMLCKDKGAPGLLLSTFEKRSANLPPWIWLPWVPQLLSGFCRHEGSVLKNVFAQIVKAYPQAIYYPLRAFYLERRDVERTRGSTSSSQHMNSVTFAEEMMSTLRRSHTSLWSSLESILEELLVKFRPSSEEEFLATMVALLDKAESQTDGITTSKEKDISLSIWKTLGKIAVKYFRQPDSNPSSGKPDERFTKTAKFKEKYRAKFEVDFSVSTEEVPKEAAGSSVKQNIPTLDVLLSLIRQWKRDMEYQVLQQNVASPLIISSRTLAYFGVCDAPDLWPGSCDPVNIGSIRYKSDTVESDSAISQSTSSSAVAALKAAENAAASAELAARTEGVGGDYGGGSSFIEIPGQYIPNSSTWADTRPFTEIHVKLVKLRPEVQIFRRNDQLVRQIGFVGSDGKTYNFLLQCALPYWTRTDERMAQTQYVFNKVLRRDLRCARAYLSMQLYAVIPVAQRLRLVYEPESRKSLQELYEKYIPGGRSESEKAIEHFSKQIKLASNESEESATTKLATDEIRLRALRDTTKKFHIDPDFFLDHVRNLHGDAEKVFHFRQLFAQQWATNAVLQHAFSVTDRMLHHVVFVETDGKVISSDFKISYNNSGLVEKTVLPFRLTPSITQLMSSNFLDSRFIPTVASVASAISAVIGDLDTVFKLLLRDDLVAYFTKSIAKSDNKTQEMEKQLNDRVVKNVASVKKNLAECTLHETPLPDYTTLIDSKPRELVKQAMNEKMICLLPAQYQGWV